MTLKHSGVVTLEAIWSNLSRPELPGALNLTWAELTSVLQNLARPAEQVSIAHLQLLGDLRHLSRCQLETVTQGMSREDAAGRVEEDERRARAYKAEMRLEEGFERGA